MAMIDAVDPPLSERCYWWVNCSPSRWDVAKAPIGHRETFLSRNDEGTKRRIFKYFEEIQPGDEILAYATSPVRRITSRLKVTRRPAEDESFECEVLQHFDTRPHWDELKTDDRLTECEPLLNNQGTLFSLTEDEFAAIRDLTEGITPEDKEPYTKEDAIEDLFMDETIFQSILDRLEKQTKRDTPRAAESGQNICSQAHRFCLNERKRP